jgi:hypothetical protein
MEAMCLQHVGKSAKCLHSLPSSALSSHQHGAMRTVESDAESNRAETASASPTKTDAAEAALEDPDMPIALPGLKGPCDVSLLEKWRACFVGTRLSAAATLGQVLVDVPDLKCLVRLEPPEASRTAMDAMTRCRAHRASFATDAADAEATAANAPDDVSEYSDSDGRAAALQLSVRTSPTTLGAATAAAAAAALGAAPLPPRSVLEYLLPAAVVPPPLLAAMQVNDAPSRKADAVGIPRWHMLVRVQVQMSYGLPCSAVGGRLIVRLPKGSPPMRGCIPKAKYSAKQGMVCPPSLLAAVLLVHLCPPCPPSP